MRIVSWNCQQGFKKKKGALAALKPDIAVLCEAPLTNPFEASLLDGPVSWHSAGSVPNKGLAVAGFHEELQSEAGRSPSCRWGVAVSRQDGPGVLGVWSVPLPGQRYGQEVLGIIDSHADWIAGGGVIVAGDFNIDANGVGNGARGAVLFAEIIRRLAELGLVSAYHSWNGEAFGEESAMTHYHQRRPDRGFHIDYCFIPKEWHTAVRAVVVGAPEQWLQHSDHMPILVDLAI